MRSHVMNWILLALSNYFLLAIGNVFEKIIRIDRSAFILLLLSSVSRFPFLLIPLLFRMGSNSPIIVLLTIFSGVLSNIAFFPYLRALKHEQVSRLVPLWNFIPPLTLIMAFIFLNEQLPVNFYFAFALIFIGSILISLKDLKGNLSKYALVLMGLSSLLYAIDSIILKYVSGFLSPTDLIFYTALGNIIFAVVLVALKKEMKKEIYLVKERKWAIGYLALMVFAAPLYLISIQNIPVSIYVALGGFQGLFVAGIALTIHHQFIKIDEKTDLRSLIIKLISILLMISGLYLLHI